MAHTGWREKYRQTLEEQARDSGGAVVMGLIAVGIGAIYATGLLPMPAWLGALF